MDIRSTHGAEPARTRESFTFTEGVDLELILDRYGVGVDCHSRFFQVCALAGRDDVVLKYKDKCEAAYKVAILRQLLLAEPSEMDSKRVSCG